MPTESRAQQPADSDGIERLAPARQYPVLCVDDERDNLLVFKALLSDEFNVLLAQSAAEALDIISNQPVAVLVADQRMPHMNGIELCHIVSERRPTVRRILLTAYSDHQTAINAINRGGVHGYLEKPWDPLAMRRTLWDAVNRVHLDRVVTELRAALGASEARVERARTLERLLHDMANATVRLSMTHRVLRRILSTSQGVPEDVRQKLEREANLLERASDHLAQLQRERAAGSGAVGAPRAENLPLDEVLRTVVALSAFPLGDRLRLVIDVSPGLTAYADRVAVARVLVNLVKNARESLERGGGVGEVRISARNEEGGVVLDVVDSGTGVPPELRDRIFEEFFTTRRESGGAGVGLAGARALAQATGGNLEFPHPQPAKGALFRLTLPPGVAQPGAPEHVHRLPPGSSANHLREGPRRK
jgi:signal transduction histidine kinase